MAVFFALASLPLADAPLRAGDVDDALGKVRVDLTSLDDRGLYGPPDGLRALHYEFCIPATASAIDEVKAIDPTAAFQSGSPGRSGCGSAAALVIGSTHQAEFRDVIHRLASLPYVEQINPCHFE